jgi:hypothetical protein
MRQRQVATVWWVTSALYIGASVSTSCPRAAVVQRPATRGGEKSSLLVSSRTVRA